MVINIIKGIIIGIALIIPGLSGSIFAIILGLYESCLYAIANFTKEPLKHGKFLLPIAIGGAIGILASARFIIVIMATFPAYSYLFFVGLVIGSVPLILKKVMAHNFSFINTVCAIVSFIVVIYLSDTSLDDTHIAIHYISNFYDFISISLAGLISVSMMAVPGISGSIVLLMLGQFGSVYNALSKSVTLILQILTGNWQYAIQTVYTVFVLVPFALGTLVGLVSISKILTFLLNKYEATVYYFVIGALLGTIVILVQIGVFPNLPSNNFYNVLAFSVVSILCIVGGILCTLLLDKK